MSYRVVCCKKTTRISHQMCHFFSYQTMTKDNFFHPTATKTIDPDISVRDRKICAVTSCRRICECDSRCAILHSTVSTHAQTYKNAHALAYTPLFVQALGEVVQIHILSIHFGFFPCATPERTVHLS